MRWALLPWPGLDRPARPRRRRPTGLAPQPSDADHAGQRDSPPAGVDPPQTATWPRAHGAPSSRVGAGHSLILLPPEPAGTSCTAPRSTASSHWFLGPVVSAGPTTPRCAAPASVPTRCRGVAYARMPQPDGTGALPAPASHTATGGPPTDRTRCGATANTARASGEGGVVTLAEHARHGARGSRHELAPGGPRTAWVVSRFVGHRLRAGRGATRPRGRRSTPVTGAPRWTFDPLQGAAAPARPTPGRRSRWDAGRDLVFVPTGAPSPDF